MLRLSPRQHLGDSLSRRSFAIDQVEERWRIRGRLCLSKYRSHPSFTRVVASDALAACEHVHRVVARDRFGIVTMCHVQLRCLSSSAAHNIAIPRPQGFSHAPSWWTSERKTKTICARHFGSDGPSLPKRRPSHGLPAVDAGASELSDPAARSGSMPTVASLTPG